MPCNNMLRSNGQLLMRTQSWFVKLAMIDGVMPKQLRKIKVGSTYINFGIAQCPDWIQA